MRKTGKVISVDNNFASVVIVRSTSCGENCATCGGGCEMTQKTVVANNTAGANVGDMVTVELSDKSVLLAAFLVYVVPMILMIIGYAAADSNGTIPAWAGAAAGFFLPFLVLFSLDKKLAKRYTANITKVWGRGQ